MKALIPVAQKVKISPQDQVTIPKSMRKQLGIEKGVAAVYLWVQDGENVHIAPQKTIDEYYGALKPAKGQQSAVDVVQQLRAHEARKILGE